MSKRFTETEIWERKWFRKLEPRLKCLWRYICDNCDISGVWYSDFELASFRIGADVDEADCEAFGDKIMTLGEDKYHLTGFIEFQYKNALKHWVKPHKAVIDKLEKHGLTELYDNCIETLQDKDKDKVKDMDKDKVKDILQELGVFTDALLEAYMNFAESRIENKHKALTERGIKMQIKDMKETHGFDEGKMITCVNHSASNGWQGLFPDSKQMPNTKPKKSFINNRRTVDCEVGDQ